MFKLKLIIIIVKSFHRIQIYKTVVFSFLKIFNGWDIHIKTSIWDFSKYTKYQRSLKSPNLTQLFFSRFPYWRHLFCICLFFLVDILTALPLYWDTESAFIQCYNQVNKYTHIFYYKMLHKKHIANNVNNGLLQQSSNCVIYNYIKILRVENILKGVEFLPQTLIFQSLYHKNTMRKP